MILLATLAIVATGLQLSPDGNLAAWADSAKVVVRNLRTHSEIPIGPGTRPRFSPDSKRLAFLRGGTVWSAPIAGGPPEALSPAASAVTDFGWQGSGGLLLLSHQRLDSYDIASGNLRTLSGGSDRIRAIEPSPDGRWVVAIHEPGHVFLHSIGKRVATRVLVEARAVPSRIRWAPDSSGFYAAESGRLYWFSLREGEPELFDLAWPDGLGADFAPLADGLIAVLRSSPRLARYRRFEEKEHDKDKDRDELKRRRLNGPVAGGISELQAGAAGKRIAWFDGEWWTATLGRRSIGKPERLGSR